MAIPRYRYVVADMLTDENIASLPLTNVSFSRSISRVGAFGGTWTIGNRTQAQAAEYLAQRLGRVALWCYRNESLWWGGPMWTMTPSQNARGGGSVSVQAATFESYPAHRRIRQALSFVDVEQVDIMRALWTQMLGTPDGPGDIHVDFDTSPSGVLRSVQYPGDGSMDYGKKIQEMGDLQGGVEHTIDLFTQDSARRKVWRTGTPKLAADIPARIVLNGRRIPSYSRTIDATKAATSFQSRGKDGLLSAVYSAEDLLAAGWPLLDMTTDRSTVDDPATLDEFTRADRDLYSGQLVTPSYEAYFDGTGWHPNRIGESILIKRTANDWFSPGLVEEVRPVSATVSVPDRGDKRESLKFAIEATATDADA